MPRLPALERAFELARTGGYRGSNDIRAALRAESYSTSDVLQLSGPSLLRQLNRLCRQAREHQSAEG
jgi:hypothetical protein